MNESRTQERCTECGQVFTLVAVPWGTYTAESVATLLRKVCCVCEACLDRIRGEDDADDTPAGEGH